MLLSPLAGTAVGVLTEVEQPRFPNADPRIFWNQDEGKCECRTYVRFSSATASPFALGSSYLDFCIILGRFPIFASPHY